MLVEILSNSKLVHRDLPAVPRVGDQIIDASIGEAQVVDVVWMTSAGTVRVYAEERYPGED